MKKKPMFAVCGLLLFSSMSFAHRHQDQANVDVVVSLPPTVWQTEQNRTSPSSCLPCCVYNNRAYSEGALLNVAGELLQCTRDPNIISTDALKWIRLKK